VRAEPQRAVPVLRRGRAAMAKWGQGDPRWIVEEREDGTNVNNWHWCGGRARARAGGRLRALLLRTPDSDGLPRPRGGQLAGRAGVAPGWTPCPAPSRPRTAAARLSGRVSPPRREMALKCPGFSGSGLLAESWAGSQARLVTHPPPP
jgi:hypothetical protein